MIDLEWPNVIAHMHAVLTDNLINSTVCELPSDPGACLAHASMPHYFFNASKGVCEEFTYGGCGGNKNNFQSLEECNQERSPNSN